MINPWRTSANHLCHRRCKDHFIRSEVGNCQQHRPRPNNELCRLVSASSLISILCPTSLLPNHHSTLPAFHVSAHRHVHCTHTEPTVLQVWTAATAATDLAMLETLSVGQKNNAVVLFLYTTHTHTHMHTHLPGRHSFYNSRFKILIR